jgi:hypothetical protein
MSQPPKRKTARQPLWITLVVLALALGGAWLKQKGVFDRSGGASAPTPSRAPEAPPSPDAPSASPSPKAGERTLADAIASRKQDVLVEASGRVVKILPDDREGDRHQRLIVEVAGGTTVLIAHNIDVAKRADVREGQAIRFKGDYIWNDRGGVVHWTHHDPAKRHPDGWIRVDGVTFD